MPANRGGVVNVATNGASWRGRVKDFVTSKVANQNPNKGGTPRLRGD